MRFREIAEFKERLLCIRDVFDWSRDSDMRISMA